MYLFLCARACMYVLACELFECECLLECVCMQVYIGRYRYRYTVCEYVLVSAGCTRVCIRGFLLACLRILSFTLVCLRMLLLNALRYIHRHIDTYAPQHTRTHPAYIPVVTNPDSVLKKGSSERGPPCPWASGRSALNQSLAAGSGA